MEEFDPKEFESISPYSDAEAVEALGKVADHPAVPAISQYLFPKEDPTFLRTALKSIHSIDEFQQLRNALERCHSKINILKLDIVIG